MLYYKDKGLTEDEEIARNNMIYLFNPCLKLLLAETNGEIFKQWGYNCCRQTAILGAAIIHNYISGYETSVYEINYDDILNGKKVNYEHCIIMADKDDRRLMIDLSRTSKPLVFAVIPKGTYDYPDYPAYRHLKRNQMKKLDWQSWVTRGMYEYITGLSPNVIYATLCTNMSFLADQDEEEVIKRAEQIYAKYTQIEKSA